jgi:hypothetical protein
MSASVSSVRIGPPSPEGPRTSHGAGSAAPEDPRRSKSSPEAGERSGGPGSAAGVGPDRPAAGSGEGLEPHWSSAIDAATD